MLAALRLWSTVPLKIAAAAATAEFKLNPDESAAFVLEEAGERESELDADYVTSVIKSTLNYWRDWVNNSVISRNRSHIFP